MEKLGAAVVGCGNIASFAHLPNLRRLTNVDIVAVCDIVEERARKAARDYGVDKYTLDYREIAEMPEVDFVVVATPPDVHTGMTIDFLKAGKHVFLEKPAAATLQDAIEIYRVARASGSKLALGFCLRFHGMFRYVKDLIEGGKIGEPVLMWRTAIGTALGVAAPARWVFKRERSGGMLVENAVHIFDAFRWYAGEYDTISAFVKTLTPGIDIEDNVVVSMRFKSGALASLTQTWTATHNYDAWGVIGDKGSVTVSGYVLGKMALSLRGSEARRVEIKEDVNAMYYRELESFVDSIVNDKEVFAGIVDGIRAMEAAIAAQKSGEEGRPVRLPLVDL